MPVLLYVKGYSAMYLLMYSLFSSADVPSEEGFHCEVHRCRSKLSCGCRWQALVGLDLEAAPGVYPLAVYTPERHAPRRTVDLRVTAKTFSTRQLRVAPSVVEPGAADLEGIARAATALAALFRSVTPRHPGGTDTTSAHQRGT